MTAAGYTLDLAMNPVPLERARTTTEIRFGSRSTRAYTPRASEDFKTTFAGMLLTQRPRPQAPGLTGPLSLSLRFWRQHRATSGHTGDIDNLTKAVLDAGNGLLWRDDSQIRTLDTTVEDVGPHVDGRIWLHLRPDVRTADAGRRYAETCERLLRYLERSDDVGISIGTHDQRAAALADWLGEVGIDLHDPTAQRTAARIFDGLILALQHGDSIGRTLAGNAIAFASAYRDDLTRAAA